MDFIKKSLLEKILGLIYPPKCIFCGKILGAESEIEICEVCKSKIHFANNVITHRNPSSGIGTYYDKVIYVCEYSGVVKDAIIRYKFFDKSLYYRTFGKLLSDKLNEMTNIQDFDIIISVPLHKSRQNSRGYNQSALIARVVSLETGIIQASRLLTRTVNTQSQSKLGKIERQSNVKDAFEVVKHFKSKINNKNILLIDDIFTTGNTINECSKVLKEAGARLVTAAVISSTAFGKIVP